MPTCGLWILCSFQEGQDQVELAKLIAELDPRASASLTTALSAILTEKRTTNGHARSTGKASRSETALRPEDNSPTSGELVPAQQNFVEATNAESVKSVLRSRVFILENTAANPNQITEISDVSSPQLPTDCLMPHMLWERARRIRRMCLFRWKNSRAAAACWNLQPSTYLRLWEWREDKMNLIGATQ